jgi:phosphatidylinositol alpha 1,6-mannosyltransferase
MQSHPGRFTLSIAGRNTDTPEVHAMFTNGVPGAQDALNFMGLTQEVAATMARHPIFLLTSDVEGMPNTIGEAMAAGAAVVARPAGGTVELIQHDRTGRIEEPAGLVPALRRLLDEPADIQRLGVAARDHVRAHHSQKTMGDTLARIYSEILQDAGRAIGRPS